MEENILNSNNFVKDKNGIFRLSFKYYMSQGVTFSLYRRIKDTFIGYIYEFHTSIIREETNYEIHRTNSKQDPIIIYDFDKNRFLKYLADGKSEKIIDIVDELIEHVSNNVFLGRDGLYSILKKK